MDDLDFGLMLKLNQIPGLVSTFARAADWLDQQGILEEGQMFVCFSASHYRNESLFFFDPDGSLTSEFKDRGIMNIFCYRLTSIGSRYGAGGWKRVSAPSSDEVNDDCYPEIMRLLNLAERSLEWPED